VPSSNTFGVKTGEKVRCVPRRTVGLCHITELHHPIPVAEQFTAEKDPAFRSSADGGLNLNNVPFRFLAVIPTNSGRARYLDIGEANGGCGSSERHLR
jgi:hypothetical protein